MIVSCVAFCAATFVATFDGIRAAVPAIVFVAQSIPFHTPFQRLYSEAIGGDTSHIAPHAKVAAHGGLPVARSYPSHSFIPFAIHLNALCLKLKSLPA